MSANTAAGAVLAGCHPPCHPQQALCQWCGAAKPHWVRELKELVRPAPARGQDAKITKKKEKNPKHHKALQNTKGNEVRIAGKGSSFLKKYHYTRKANVFNPVLFKKCS